MTKPVLVIAAHADDEVLGCGGTIVKHRVMGDNVKIAFMTDGVSSRISIEKPEKTDRRKAVEILGRKSLSCLRFP
jgi:N-acetylglucosamine malate deacetylase 1